MEPMKKITAAALAGLVLATTPTHAADLFGTAAPPMAMPSSDGPAVEVGTNWYIRGDVGLSLDNAPTVSFSGIDTPPQGDASNPWKSTIGPSAHSTDFALDVGFGYRFSDYFRMEATYEYRTGPGGTNTSTAVCPYGLYGLSSQTTPVVQLGYYYDLTNTCDGVLKLTQYNNTGLGSGFVDLGTWWNITPYIGVGGGLNQNVMSGTLQYYETANGQPYRADLSPTGTFPHEWVDLAGNPITPKPNVTFAPQNWDRVITSTKYTPAWALMAGVGIQISSSATLDLGYRYLNTGVSNALVNTQTGAVIKQNNTSQQFKIGVRYMVN